MLCTEPQNKGLYVVVRNFFMYGLYLLKCSAWPYLAVAFKIKSIHTYIAPSYLARQSVKDKIFLYCNLLLQYGASV